MYPSSNLVDLVRNLSHYFGIDPPLYSKVRPNPNPNPSPSFNASGSSVRPEIPPRNYSQSPYGTAAGGGRISSPAPVAAGTEDPGEVYRRNVINKLVENVHNDVEELKKKREVETDGMLTAQAVLQQREEEISKGLRDMQYEKECLEQQLQMILMNTDVLEGWVRENEGKLSGGKMANLNVDDAFEPLDSLSKQMLECTSSDLAVEDVIYALDKAVQEGSIPVDIYLKNVRLLSREQFFHRAMSAKVRAVQMQAQVTSMASRAPPYAV